MTNGIITESVTTMNWIDIRVRKPTKADADRDGKVLQLLMCGNACCYSWENLNGVVAWMPIPKFEPVGPLKPKYRPFKNADEFRLFRDRWVKGKQGGCIFPPCSYSPKEWSGVKWVDAFDRYEFEDGTPFGMLVSEDD